MHVLPIHNVSQLQSLSEILYESATMQITFLGVVATV